jgi:hypothetical protein
MPTLMPSKLEAERIDFLPERVTPFETKIVVHTRYRFFGQGPAVRRAARQQPKMSCNGVQLTEQFFPIRARTRTIANPALPCLYICLLRFDLGHLEFVF